MSKSEILIQLEEDYVSMANLIDQQKFTTGDATAFMSRYKNVLNKMEQLIKSRDINRMNWNSERDHRKELEIEIKKLNKRIKNAI